MNKKKNSIIIIGAGPSGLGAAYELSSGKNDLTKDILIVDKNSLVGGLARTHTVRRSRFDVGPHRFYTKNKEVLELWKKTLGDEFLEVDRMTRMYYKGRYFRYPIEFSDILKNFETKDLFVSTVSYIQAKLLLRNLKPQTFEEWITKHFGKRLYEIFFKTYTEKVWGVPCEEIGSEWAAQRIKNTNFTEVVKNALLPSKQKKAKSWVERFYYPKYGAGYMYEVLAKNLTKRGASLELKTKVTKVNYSGNKVTSIELQTGSKRKSLKVDHLFTSMPLTHFIKALHPKPPAKILNATKNLRFRDHITVNLTVRSSKSIFPDNWIYIHDPSLKMARVANYNNFTETMTANSDTIALSVEYFAFKNDAIWKMKNRELIRLAEKELIKAKLLKRNQILHGFVVRESESYPTYYTNQRKHFETLKSYVKEFSNVSHIGRGGLFKYNNMDHAMYSGILAARNYKDNTSFDVWKINDEAEYLESGADDS